MAGRLAEFELGRHLGAGAFGDVREAFDRRRRLHVALKRLRAPDAHALYRFKKEFRALAGIAHPNLATLHELFSDAEGWYIAMELVRGIDIVRDARRDGRLALASTQPLSARVDDPAFTTLPDAFGPRGLDVERLRATLVQLVCGVQALHHAGCVHRDLKPSNVLVTDEGVVKVLDFGLVTELWRTGDSRVARVGTPRYMAPEQVRGEPITEAADWYGVGALLFEALTGDAPFDGTPQETLAAKLVADAPDPRTRNPELPDDLCDVCVRLLERDPRARPRGEEIVDRVLERRISSRPPASAAPPAWVGREAELRALRDAYAACRAHRRATVVHVTGASGVGKTALVRAFVAGLEPRAQVLEGRCYEGDGLPFKAVDTIVDALTARLMRLVDAAAPLLPRDFASLQRLFPALHRLGVRGAFAFEREPSDPFEVRRRGFAALRELLDRLAADAPLVVVVDDLQWGDVDGVALLQELVRPPRAPPVLFVLGYRAEAVDTIAALRALRSGAAAEGEDVRVVALGPLPRRDAMALAEALLAPGGTPAEADVEAIARESAGHPLFVHELARHVREGRSTDEVSVDDLIACRVGRLDPSARATLEAVAVAASAVDAAILREVVGLTGEGMLAVIGALKAEHLLRTRRIADGEGVEAYHDRIAERTRAMLDPNAARAWHARWADVLAPRADVDPEVIAAHHRAAGRPLRALPFAARAAEEATRSLAFERAVALHRFVVELTPLGADGAAAIARVRLADALVNVGRGAEAAELYVQAAELRPEAERVELWRRASEQLLASGHVDRGMAILARVLARAGMTVPSVAWALVTIAVLRVWLRLRGTRFTRRAPEQIDPRALARIDACLAAAEGMTLVRTVQAAHFALRGLAYALRAGEPGRVARLLCAAAMFGAMTERRAADAIRARALHDAGARVAVEVGGADVVAFADLSSAVMRFSRGEWLRAIPLHDRSKARHDRAPWPFSRLHADISELFAVIAEVQHGAYDAARARRERVLRDARDRSDLLLEVSFCVGHAALVDLARDEPWRLRRTVTDAMLRWASRAYTIPRHLAHYALALADLYDGHAASVLDRLARHDRDARASGVLRVVSVSVAQRHLRAAAHLAAAATSSHPAHHLDCARRDAEQLRRERAAWGAPIGDALLAACAAASGDRLTACRRASRAAEAFDALDMTAHAHVARYRLGQWRGGDAGRAITDEAEARLHEHGVVAPSRFARVLLPDPRA